MEPGRRLADARALTRTSRVPRSRPALRSAPLLTAHGWENKLQGCTDFANEAATSARTFAPNGAPDPSSYSALWYGTPGSAALRRPTVGLPGFPVVDPAAPARCRHRRTTCRSRRASTTMYNLTYGNDVPGIGRPGRVPGQHPTPFPYPAIDRTRTRLVRRRATRRRRASRPTTRRSRSTRVTRCSAPTHCRSRSPPPGHAGRPCDRYADRSEHPAHGPGLAERHHRQVRWRGEPVRQHPRQELRH